MSRFKIILLVILSSLVFISSSVQGEEKEAKNENISDFFKASKYKLFSINPSGTAVAFIEPKAATYDLVVYDLKRGTMDDPITFERQQLQVQHKNKIMSWETHYNKIYELKWLSDSFLSLKQHSNGSS